MCDRLRELPGMYVCGITPYDATHVGHAYTYVVFDLLHRVWGERGLDVNYVQNVTDVETRLLERAAAIGVDLAGAGGGGDRALPQRHDCAQRAAAAALRRSRRVDVTRHATDRAAAGAGMRSIRSTTRNFPIFTSPRRETPSSVPCRASTKLRLPRCSPSVAATLSARARRRHWTVWCWRLARAGEPSWESPFGLGRPGWHIECTAIALDLLGTNFDVQGGGTDLIFPHHEMCAAEARVATDQPFAKAYMHSGMVGLHGEKMSKSKGNLVLVSDLRESGVDPMAIRLALLASHYRDDWDWTDELLASATERLDRWREAVRLDAGMNANETIASIRSALDDDLNAPAALAAVDAWAGASTAIDADDADAPGPRRPGVRRPPGRPFVTTDSSAHH